MSQKIKDEIAEREKQWNELEYRMDNDIDLDDDQEDTYRDVVDYRSESTSFKNIETMP